MTDSNKKLETVARNIVDNLPPLEAKEAVDVFTMAIRIVLAKAYSNDTSLSQIVKRELPRIIKSPANTSNIERDLEVKTYIDTFEQPISQIDLRRILIKKFGKKRAPSRSGLHRYLSNRQQDCQI